MHIKFDEQQWVDYNDPHLPDGAKVIIISDKAMLAWFPPNFEAPRHSHPGNTTYLILQGSIKFGDEGWFTSYDYRSVNAGYEYGPETAGDHGVFFYIESDQPISIDWAK